MEVLVWEHAPLWFDVPKTRNVVEHLGLLGVGEEEHVPDSSRLVTALYPSTPDVMQARALRNGAPKPAADSSSLITALFPSTKDVRRSRAGRAGRRGQLRASGLTAKQLAAALDSRLPSELLSRASSRRLRTQYALRFFRSLIKRFARSFGIGLAYRLVLSVPAVFLLLLRKRYKDAGHKCLEGLREGSSWGMFLGCLLAGFELGLGLQRALSLCQATPGSAESPEAMQEATEEATVMTTTLTATTTITTTTSITSSSRSTSSSFFTSAASTESFSASTASSASAPPPSSSSALHSQAQAQPPPSPSPPAPVSKFPLAVHRAAAAAALLSLSALSPPDRTSTSLFSLVRALDVLANRAEQDQAEPQKAETVTDPDKQLEKEKPKPCHSHLALKNRTGRMWFWYVMQKLWRRLQEQRHVVLFAVASAQVTWAYTCHRDALAAYGKSLDSILGDELAALPAFLSGRPNPQVWVDTCALRHARQSVCWKAAIPFFYRSLLRGMKITLPVQLVPAALFKWRHFLKHPAAEAIQLIRSMARSALFLALLPTGAFSLLCFASHRHLPLSPANTAIGGLLLGCLLWVEAEHRRRDVALYVAVQSLSILHRLVTRPGQGPRGVKLALPPLERLLFAASFAFIMNRFLNYQCHKDPTAHTALGKANLGMLTFLFSRPSQTTTAMVTEEPLSAGPARSLPSSRAGHSRAPSISSLHKSRECVHLDLLPDPSPPTSPCDATRDAASNGFSSESNVDKLDEEEIHAAKTFA